jgi:7-keto-8-aminopelargonate synthetase-like enzyme
VQNAAIEAAKEFASGNHGPRMLGGNIEILIKLEATISKFFNKEHAITCSSGYLACMSVT